MQPPSYSDPNEHTDWTKEPFHRAFVRRHLYRRGKWPAGLVAQLYMGIVAALIWGLYTLVQWWMGA